MSTRKECPMCGEAMRLVVRELIDRVPGTTECRTTTATEWLCPECDYFEEVDEEGTAG